MKVKVARPKDWSKAKASKRELGPDSPEAEEVLAAIRVGNYIHVACMTAGISQPTYNRWLKIGKLALESGDEAHAAHARFYVNVRKALADAEVGLLARIEAASHCEWQPAAWLLERRYHKRWGKRLQTTNEVAVREVRLPASLEKTLALLPPTEAQAFFRTMAKLEDNSQMKAQYEAAAEALEGATS